ncbi:MAG: hypothetical protein ABIH23_01460, partial [bacterium]
MVPDSLNTSPTSPRERLIKWTAGSWFLPIYGMCSGVVLFLLGTYVSSTAWNMVAILLLLLYFIVFVPLGILLAKSRQVMEYEIRQERNAEVTQISEQYRENLQKSTEEYDTKVREIKDRTSKIEFQMSLSSDATAFLQNRLKKTTKFLAEILYSLSTDPGSISGDKVKVNSIIEETLMALCHMFRSCASELKGIPS